MSRVLFVDDDRLLRETLELDLVRRGHAVTTCADGETALALIKSADFDVIVTDLNMRNIDGIQLTAQVLQSRDDIPIIVLTAFGSMESAIAAMRAGAYDFLSKPIRLDVLSLAIERAANHRALRGELRRLHREAAGSKSSNGIIAASSTMQHVLQLVERVASSEATVLITGESGTGKEVIARAIHAASARAEKPFVAVNCAAFPEALLESELFGHVRGAFTDARTNEPGLFVAAHGGTVLLDEIGDMPLPMQPKLLRVLQERTVRPVGGTGERPIDVRVIAATNRDLETAIEEERFRQDLFYRINVVNINLPPLRARTADILPLALAFVTQASKRSGKDIHKISQGAADRLMAYPWPGNIRELANCIEHAVALARFDAIGPDDLPEKVRAFKSSHVLVVADDPSELVSLEHVERRYIGRVMEIVGGNKSAAARILGLDRKRLYRMLERLGLAR